MELNKGQKKALDALLSGENIFLTGGAGTGKTFTLNYFLNLPQNKRKHVLICAPTGIAALQIGGATLHRTFKIPLKVIDPIDKLGQIDEILKSAEIIVIDEISMCRIDTFQYVIRKIIKAEKISKTHKQIILVGDFFQLPPVVVSSKRIGKQYSDKDVLIANYGNITKNGFAFLSPCWRLAKIKTVILTKVIRQKDHDFSEALNKIRVGDASGLGWISQNSRQKKLFKSIILCSSNRENEEINNRQLALLPGKLGQYKTYIYGEDLSPSEIPVPDILGLKVGCRVMSLTNDCNSTIRYNNGSLGTVDQLEHHGADGENYLTIKFDNGNIVDIPRYRWDIKKYIAHEEEGQTVFEQETVATIIQYPIKIAYAITIHKSQGQTYDKVTVHPDRCFAAGQLYVALSRAIAIKKLYIEGVLSPEQLICSKEVQQFYDDPEFLLSSKILTNQKTMASDEIEKEFSKLPFYAEKQIPKIKIHTKKHEKEKVGKNKKIDINNPHKMKKDSSVLIAFKEASNLKQKSFVHIVGILANMDVTSQNCVNVYHSLSEAKQHIAKIVLG